MRGKGLLGEIGERPASKGEKGEERERERVDEVVVGGREGRERGGVEGRVEVDRGSLQNFNEERVKLIQLKQRLAIKKGSIVGGKEQAGEEGVVRKRERERERWSWEEGDGEVELDQRSSPDALKVAEREDFHEIRSRI